MEMAGAERGSGALDVIGLDLYWIPLGAGADVVRLSGRAYEWLAASAQHRRPCDLYHSTLVVRSEDGAYVIEMTPIPAGGGSAARGVVSEGPVGLRSAGRIRVFRYEIRRWRDGVIPDIAFSVGSPVHLSSDVAVVQAVLSGVSQVPTAVWGRDELCTGDMWNSNSVVAWLLASVDLVESAGLPPGGGRAPGWAAGVIAADRERAGGTPWGGDVSGNRWPELLGGIGSVVRELPAFATAPLYRRKHLRWGASPAEVASSLPGDELLPLAQFRATRAISIDAPPDVVWPWLVQVGAGRAGWYSNDLLDNLGRPSAVEILPEFQALQVGQWIPMSPWGPPSAANAFVVDSFEADHWLLWTKPDSTWAWSLTPMDGGGTRLVTRVRAAYDWRRPLKAVLGVVLMEFGDFAMCRRMLRGIKARSEALVIGQGQTDPAHRMAGRSH